MTLLDRNAALIADLAREYGIEARAVRALIQVEAAGEGLHDGYPVIRLEVHLLWLGVRPALRKLVDEHFRVLGPRAWEGHEFRHLGSWQPIHRRQPLERIAYAVASEIDPTVAIEATSWGCGQILGRHWSALRYTSPTAFVADQQTEEGQLRTLFRFLRDVSGAMEDVRARRWTDVARKYNGHGQIEWYGGRLAAAYERA